MTNEELAKRILLVCNSLNAIKYSQRKQWLIEEITEVEKQLHEIVKEVRIDKE